MARIAIILGRLVIGGTTMDTLQVAQHLQGVHEVLLITGGGERDEFEAAYLTAHLPGVRQERINGFSGSIHPIRDYIAYRKLRLALRRFKPQIVHTHTAKAGLLGRLAASAEHIPVIIHTYHGLMFSGYYSKSISQWVVRAEQWLSKKTTRLIALSQTQKLQITGQYRVCPPEKVAVVPLGIDISAFTADRAAKRASFRSKYFLAAGEIAVGIVGRIVPVKNHGVFLRVAEEVLKSQPGVRFFIIGDGPLRRKLQAECVERNIDFTYFPEEPRKATLTFTSWITEVDWAMAGLDIVTLTSFNEGTPVSLMEAQAAGKPVIAMKAGGIEDIVQHNITGFTVDQGAIADFAARLLELCQNAATRQVMGTAGEQYAASHFQKERQVSDLNALYSSLLAG
jgi:glycosyltransferase involved in cell wall biosynthesis